MEDDDLKRKLSCKTVIEMYICSCRVTRQGVRVDKSVPRGTEDEKKLALLVTRRASQAPAAVEN